MKRSWIFILCFLVAGYSGMAQMNPDSLSYGDPALTSSKLFTQLVGAIKPSSFAGSTLVEAQSFLDGAVTENKPAAVAQNVVSLAGFIKPGLFKTGFNPANLKTQASKVTAASQAGSLMKSFESNLKPAAMTDVWKMQKANWVNQLALLK